MANCKDYFKELQNDLCKGKDSCSFRAKGCVYVKILNKKNKGEDKGENFLHPTDVFGELKFSENENCIIFSYLVTPPYSSKGDIRFKIDCNNFVYDCELRRIMMVDAGITDSNVGYVAVITLEDVFSAE